MTDILLREQLHQQIDNLPDDIVQEVADFALFLMTKRQKTQAHDLDLTEQVELGREFMHEFDETFRELAK